MNPQLTAINDYLSMIKKYHPVILTIANYVTAQKLADCISAIGASPIMIDAPEEANDIVKICSAITINLGTINNHQINLINSVLRNNYQHHPVILDPVAVGASTYRQKIVKSLLSEYSIDVIRANTGEVATLMNQEWRPLGIDSGIANKEIDLHNIAQQCAQKYHCLVVMTGPVDVITDGRNTYMNQLNCEPLSQNVGSGDILSSMLGTFISCSNNNPLQACSVATQFMTLVGHWAELHSNGLGSWQTSFLDGLSNFELLKEDGHDDK